MDVVALGDAMVSFSPPGSLRLEQARQLDVFPTGAEANAAVAMARLGTSVGWFSKLPDHPLARLMVSAVASHGVDTSRVIWTSEGRIGTLYYERAAPPRPARVWYDRQNSAFTTLTPAELDWAYLTSAKVTLMAGTAPALSPTLRETTRRIAEEIHRADRVFALDVNYRSKLWSAEAAAEYFSSLLPLVGLLFCGIRDAERVFGFTGNLEEVARRFRERFGIPLVVITAGADGALALADHCYRAPRLPSIAVLDPVGAGDAFAGGFLAGFLEAGIQRGLDVAAAAGALHCTIVGDRADLSRSDIDDLLASGDQDIQR